jgi:uncharacterized protein (DUF58 family)
MLYFRPKGRGTDIAAALEYLSRVVRRRAVVFLLSDFVAPDYTRALRVANRRHDLVAVTITDPAEDELPPLGLMLVTDAETGETRMMDTRSRSFQEEFRRRRVEAKSTRERTFRRYRVDCIDVHTDRPYTDPLVAFFRRREREMAS